MGARVVELFGLDAAGSGAGRAGEIWATVAIDVTLKATVILLLAWVLATLLSRSAAALRHLVWLLTVVSLLALPLLSTLLPTVRVPLPAAVTGLGIAPSAILAPAESVPGAGSWFRIPAFGEAIQSGAGPGDSNLGPADERASGVSMLGVAPDPAAGAGSASLPGGSARFAAGLWGAGVLAFLGRLLLAGAWVRRTERRASVLPPGRITDAARGVAASLGIRRPFRLLVGPSEALPMTWGIRTPVILLPSAVASWSDGRLIRVLTHELSHVRRMDPPTQVVAELARALYWFHPLAWVAVSRLRVERELACDDAVVRTGARPSAVAEDLVALARRTRPAGLAGIAGFALSRPSALERRVAALLDGRRRASPPLLRGTGYVACGVAALLVLPLSIVRPATGPGEPVAGSTTIAPVAGGGQGSGGAPIEIDPIPRISVPAVDPGDPERSDRVVTPFLLPDGRLVVPLGGSATLRVFLPDGELADELRAPGAGGGRLRLTGAWPRGDTIEALEAHAQRVTRFLPDGTTELVGLSGAPGLVELPVPGALPDGWLGVGIEDAGYDRRDAMFVHRFGLDGVGRGEIAQVEGMLRERTSGISGPGPLSPRARFALHGGRLYVGETLTPVIRVFGPTGVLERELVWPAEPAPDPEGAFAASVQALTAGGDPEQAEDSRRRFEAHPVPGRVSVFWDFLVDPRGFVWIRPFDEERHSIHLGGAEHGGAGPGGTWLVLSPEGEEAATIEVPGDLELLTVSQDAVLGVATDPSGVRSVRVHSLRRLP